MKKILIATTALVASAGFASAEIAFSGTAAMGLQYNNGGVDKTKILSYVILTPDFSGETDGGLSFGATTNIRVDNNGGGYTNDDTTVYISGAFGKLSMGAVAEADEVAGLSDIGFDGLDVDDVAEALVGDELGDLLGVSLGHNVNYTYSSGALSFSLSGRLPTSHAGTAVDSYAAGIKYTFGDAYVGLGYADHKIGIFNGSVVSLFGGATFSGVTVKALYSDANGDFSGAKAYGLNASYKMDALTLSAGYGKADLGGGFEQQSFGIGAAYDLGGGASVVGGIARIEEVGVIDENVWAAKETRADFGLVFKF
jgi:outer membrane protein OmpU